jgi:invasion protein IalB
MHYLVRWLLCTVFAIAIFTPTGALAAKRVALVIGNSAYKFAGELPNPKNDASDMSAVFKRLGFQVVDGIDLDKAAFDRKIRDFATALQGAELGVFFYAGHGLQVGGQNYLVPTDAELSSQDGLDFEMVRLDLVHRTMERAIDTNVIFLDACRNNPLERNLRRAMGTREIGQGLAAVQSGSGTLISFSTQPGNVAADGTGRNSPFAGALVRHLSSSNDDLSAVLIAVRNDVMKETQRSQIPWEHSALTGRLYFGTPPQTASPEKSVKPGPEVSQSEAERAWTLTKDATNVAVLEAFVARFKDTFYADLAKVRIEELKKQQTAAVCPKPTAKPDAPVAMGKLEEKAVKPGPEVSQSEAERAWTLTKDATNIAMLEAFVARFKDTFYADLAKVRIEELRKQQTAAVSPKPTAKPDAPVAMGRFEERTKRIEGRLPGADQSRWLKLCDIVTVGSPAKPVKECMTQYENLDRNTGAVVVSAAVRQLEGNPNQHLMVTVPVGTLQSPDMALRIYPKDFWAAAYRNEKIDDSRLRLIWRTSVCREAGCTADTEATPELIAELKQAGGIVVFVTDKAGAQVGLPIPLAGFEQAYTGPSNGNSKDYAATRQVLIDGIKAWKAEQAKEQAKQKK